MLDSKTLFWLPSNLHRNEGLVTMLYFLQSRDLLKIGIANDMEKRLKQYRLHNPHPLTLHKVRPLPRPFAREAERRIHEALKEHAHHGEWFTADFPTAYAAARPIVALAFTAARRLRDGSFGSPHGNVKMLRGNLLEEANG